MGEGTTELEPPTYLAVRCARNRGRLRREAGDSCEGSAPALALCLQPEYHCGGLHCGAILRGIRYVETPHQSPNGSIIDPGGHRSAVQEAWNAPRSPRPLGPGPVLSNLI